MAVIKPGDGRSRLQTLVNTENYTWLGHVAVDLHKDKSLLLDCILTAIRTKQFGLLDGDLSKVLVLANTGSTESDNGMIEMGEMY